MSEDLLKKRICNGKTLEIIKVFINTIYNEVDKLDNTQYSMQCRTRSGNTFVYNKVAHAVCYELSENENNFLTAARRFNK